MKNKKVLLIAACALLIASMLIVYFVFSPKPSEGTKKISIEVEHLASENKSFEISTDADYLRQALEENGLVAGIESTYGLWVQTVDGETADDSNEEWWGYTINGETALYGVDEQLIYDGDTIVFTLNVGYETYN